MELLTSGPLNKGDFIFISKFTNMYRAPLVRSKKDNICLLVKSILARDQIQITVQLFEFSLIFDLTRATESRSVGFEPTTLGFGDPRSTELN